MAKTSAERIRTALLESHYKAVEKYGEAVRISIFHAMCSEGLPVPTAKGMSQGIGKDLEEMLIRSCAQEAESIITKAL